MHEIILLNFATFDQPYNIGFCEGLWSQNIIIFFIFYETFVSVNGKNYS